jgi:hypothetical protein
LADSQGSFILWNIKLNHIDMTNLKKNSTRRPSFAI